MKKETRRYFCIAGSFLIAFLLWTIAVCFIDVRMVGPQDSSVGFACINQFFHNMTGVHMSLYTITDWLGLVPVGFGFGFSIVGLIQWIKRKSLAKVDGSILLLGGFYILVIIAYIFFEEVVINYRPVLINGVLEASYPSSTTMLVMSVLPTAIIQFNSRIENLSIRKCFSCFISIFIVFMVLGRLISGVHWFSDIIGSGLLSAGLVMLYYSFFCLLHQ